MTPTPDTLIPKQLWQAVQPLLPTPHPATAAAHALTTARRWSAASTSCAPASPGGRSPRKSLAAAVRSPARRRLRDWQRAGVWQQLHHLLVEELSRQGRLDWSRASLDSVSVRAKRGAC